MIKFKSYCRFIGRLVSDRLDAPIASLSNRLVDRHLANCHSCRKDAAFFAELKKAAAETTAPVPPTHVWERISLYLDEHPWADDHAGAHSKDVRAGSNQRPAWTNLAGGLAGIALAVLLGLHGPAAISVNQPIASAAREDISSEPQDIRLYMLAHHSQFPLEVRRHYLNWITGVDRRITTIKSALDRNPENRLIQAQLAAAYENKLSLYREISRPPQASSERPQGPMHASVIERDRHYD